jgi:adenosine deaminase
VRVTLGSDDPPYWQASIGGEYAVARREWGLDDAALLAITRTADRGGIRTGGAPSALLARIQQ